MVAPRSTKPLLLVAATGLLLATQLFLISPASAHGSVSNPPSRTYLCRFNQPDAGACGRAWAANPQALYDWMEVNIGDVAGNHRARIPDGKLCSAGRAKYAAFDEPAADWPTTPLTPDANGRYRIAYEASAPHATEYFRLYVTSADYQPTHPLAWGDLELVHDSGRLSAQPSYQFEFTLPARSGHHILFQVWQRSDSPEAFYSCSDVLLGGGPAPAPTTTTTAAPTTTAPSTTTAPTRPTTPTTVDSTTSAPASTSSTAPSTTAAPPRPTTSLPVTSAPSTTSVNASSTSARPTTTTLSSTTLDRETSSIPAPSGAGQTDDAVAVPPSLPTSSTSQPLGEAGQAATTVVPTSPSSTALTSAPAAANGAEPRAATDVAASTAANEAAVATTSDADSGRLPLPVIIGGGLLASIVLGGAAAIAIRRRWPWLGWNQPVLLAPAVNRPRNR